MSLLTFCTEVLDEIGVVAPSSIVGNNDLTARRMFASAKAEGQHLFRAHNWSILHREFELETSTGVDNYALPDDWGRAIGDTAWDRTQFWQMRGNKTPAEWQMLQSGLTSTPAARRKFRIVNGPLAGSLLLFPTPTTSGDELVVEYVSNFWCEDTNGDGKATFTADTDDVRIDHELFRLGLLWRARRALGMGYGDERNDALMALGDAIKADIAVPTFSLVPPSELPIANIPDGSWGQ